MKIDTVIAANRFGLGARPGELRAIGDDSRAWLRQQVRSPAPVPQPVVRVAGSAEILREFQTLREEMQAARKRQTDRQSDARQAEDLGKKVRDILGPAYRAQAEARYLAAVATDLPFQERLVHFWTNHFAVSADKPPVTGLVGTLENEAVRPHVTGHFVDMLMAVEKHPAMLLYLDNQASIGPNSQLAQRAKRFRRNNNRKLDINENLGREILELHTLGVDGGYTQQDVTTFSAVITGWSVGGGQGRLAAGTPGEFHFRAAIHEPGTKEVLGKSYKQEGIAQGEAVLRDLARHPSTARHIATKLARHFIADDPPAAAVDRLAQAYLDSDGNLPEVYAAVIESPEAWAEPLAKYKTPHDFVISGVRALGVVPDQPRNLMGSLMLLGQPPYRPGSPAGWPDTTADWDGADGLMKRIEWASTLSRRAGNAFDPLALAGWTLGPALGEHTETAIRRAESRAQGLTLTLVSPEFQRR